MKKNLVLLFLLCLVFMACSTGKTTILTVASKTVDCHGAFPQKCMLVKKQPTADWEFFYSQIEGFHYTEGYEYILKVKEETVSNPPADGSSIKYILVKEMNKEAKTSENLPPSPGQ